MPGRRANCSLQPLERGGEGFHPNRPPRLSSARELAHVLRRVSLCLAHCLVDRRNDHILQHFHIVGVDCLRVNRNAHQLALAADDRRTITPPAVASYCFFFHLLLHLQKVLLHLLRLLHHLHLVHAAHGHAAAVSAFAMLPSSFI